ncbi:hypothetical protein CB0940_09092 [Cercospora beticola]|uniref:Heterokaryon incompatibility domain-containing protein n=2 Tax=Cercospora beticola TaxID=122368 RepID=A0A2G5HHH4_CERBT|nr:hypothetical protein CB0940_09092 [Cercospora beticola]PIA91979.1 hypothetical protein CB0940_09092 [Cercospora beticola]
MEPLRDPKRQIRLLHLFPGAADDSISCEVSVRGFDRSTHEYLAISYTWGDTAHPRGIFIDNELRMVRQNCHYALWQARYHYPDAYIWIDAFCIDQENLEEKSRQVAMMSKIFAQATEVLACVGPDHGDSEFLWNFSQDFSYEALYPKHREAFTVGCNGEHPEAAISCEELWDNWEASNSVEALERFLKACHKFMNRPYWERLWILQEVTVARRKEVLCGRFRLPWTVTHNLALLQDLNKAHALLAISGFTFVMISRWSPTECVDESVMSLFRHYKCQDARDRIFGTQAFLRFNDIKFHIEPDYSKCALELAMTIMSHYTPWTFPSKLLCLLEVNMHCPQLQALIVRRLHQDASMVSDVPAGYHMAFNTTRLRRDGKGRLTCSLGSLQAAHKDLAMLDFITFASNDRTFNEMLSECVKVYAGDEPAMFLGNEAREGDYLAELEWGTGLLFVLRPRTKRTFKIVSQGFSLMSHAICWDKCDCVNQGIVHDALMQSLFATSLSIEDVVVFFGQDLLGHDEERELQHDPTARLRRLITPVSSQTRPIAIMESDDHENDWESEDDPYEGGDEAESDDASESDDTLESDN